MTTPMGAERFVDRFRFYKGQPQQQRGVLELFEAISRTERGQEILCEQAPWALTFSEEPPAPAEPQPPAGGLDPRGSEEAGMAGPRMPAPVKAGDSYLLVNDRDGDLEAYDHSGQFLWKIPCLARGQGADTEWESPNTDTPPGLYKVGSVWRDYERLGDFPAAVPWDLLPYGWFTLDLVELEGQERRYGRAGIAIHGGGSDLGRRGCWQPFQPLLRTNGCVRVHNADLRDKIVPLLAKGTVYVGVFQEKK
jgi:hypothetical protein